LSKELRARMLIHDTASFKIKGSERIS